MKMNGEKPALLLALALLSGIPAASLPMLATAESAGGQPSAGSLQATVDSKMRLVKLLLDRSPAVLRIPDSGNAQAKGLL
ncbi:MAG: hypothetical protein ACM34A_07810, partial [Bacillota bacterium]